MGYQGGWSLLRWRWKTHEFIMQPASRQVEATPAPIGYRLHLDRLREEEWGGVLEMSATFCRCMQSDCCCCRQLLLLFANALIFHLVGEKPCLLLLWVCGKSCNIFPLPWVKEMFSRILLPRKCFVRNYAYLLAKMLRAVSIAVFPGLVFSSESVCQCWKM